MLPWHSLKHFVTAVAAAFSAILAFHGDPAGLAISSKVLQTHLFGWSELLAGTARAMGGITLPDMNGAFMGFFADIEGVPISTSDWTDGGTVRELSWDEWVAEPICFDFDFGESFADVADSAYAAGSGYTANVAEFANAADSYTANAADFANAADPANATDAADAPEPSFVFFPNDDAQFVEDDTALEYEDQWEEGGNEEEGLPSVRIIAIAALVFSSLRSLLNRAFKCSSVDDVKLDDQEEGDAVDENRPTPVDENRPTPVDENRPAPVDENRPTPVDENRSTPVTPEPTPRPTQRLLAAESVVALPTRSPVEATHSEQLVLATSGLAITQLVDEVIATATIQHQAAKPEPTEEKTEEILGSDLGDADTPKAEDTPGAGAEPKPLQLHILTLHDTERDICELLPRWVHSEDIQQLDAFVPEEFPVYQSRLFNMHDFRAMMGMFLPNCSHSQREDICYVASMYLNELNFLISPFAIDADGRETYKIHAQVFPREHDIWNQFALGYQPLIVSKSTLRSIVSLFWVPEAPSATGLAEYKDDPAT
ncbi:hypothetical protein HWV62_7644 [Athelia sp. TMB]|nr:hypothetical protein HWV62_7644 [Athelia sp. TMB]